MKHKFRNEYQVESDMIHNILENFDFKKVSRTMKFLNWKWCSSEPVSEEMLKKSAIDRLKSAIEVAKKGQRPNSTYFSSSGGLKASAWKNRYGHIEGVQLEFVLTDWLSDGDN